MDGAVLSNDALVLRYFGEGGESDRLLVVNFGVDLALSPAAEPLLAPPLGRQWGVLLSTEDPRYGGDGTPRVESPETGWKIPGQAAFALRVALKPS